jgi:hypothetical protein
MKRKNSYKSSTPISSAKSATISLPFINLKKFVVQLPLSYSAYKDSRIIEKSTTM